MKLYELRKESNFIKSINIGDSIYIVCRNNYIICRINNIIKFSNIDEVFRSIIDHKQIVPSSINAEDAKNKYDTYYTTLNNSPIIVLGMEILG